MSVAQEAPAPSSCLNSQWTNIWAKPSFPLVWRGAPLLPLTASACHGLAVHPQCPPPVPSVPCSPLNPAIPHLSPRCPVSRCPVPARNALTPDPPFQNGLTPLHVAAHYDNQKVALLLLEKGASPHATAKVSPPAMRGAEGSRPRGSAAGLLLTVQRQRWRKKCVFSPGIRGVSTRRIHFRFRSGIVVSLRR